ncbi:WapI family immunity protein [Micromonospora sp. URMC 103]|uniref:WapI family immunity protein n=1 Tax=Micromonospora sp. URMC 103 TaxID=3423406 RepID=UPI003F1C94D1
MEVRSDDGARLRIRPVGYQPGVEPPVEPEEMEGWDDWLLIEVDARTADGQAWSHSEPCLTVAEAGVLADWLSLQARLATQPSTLPAVLRFTEPNLTFRTRVIRRRRMELVVEFSYESLPPWMRRPLSAVYPLPLTVSADALAVAAEQWSREIEAYPQRVIS